MNDARHSADRVAGLADVGEHRVGCANPFRREGARFEMAIDDPVGATRRGHGEQYGQVQGGSTGNPARGAIEWMHQAGCFRGVSTPGVAVP